MQLLGLPPTRVPRFRHDLREIGRCAEAQQEVVDEDDWVVFIDRLVLVVLWSEHGKAVDARGATGVGRGPPHTLVRPVGRDGLEGGAVGTPSRARQTAAEV